MNETYRVIVKHKSGTEEIYKSNVSKSELDDAITDAHLNNPDADDIWEEVE
jgi:hypothetical protein